mmetsp:Transcript_25529/g.75221  ORF Transcript_25529/g.75221 Transcript_25529/m.75221 type:complete len:202 (-) Transcript_25529:1762-2367(-)
MSQRLPPELGMIPRHVDVPLQLFHSLFLLPLPLRRRRRRRQGGRLPPPQLPQEMKMPPCLVGQLQRQRVLENLEVGRVRGEGVVLIEQILNERDRRRHVADVEIAVDHGHDGILIHLHPLRIIGHIDQQFPHPAHVPHPRQSAQYGIIADRVGQYASTLHAPVQQFERPVERPPPAARLEEGVVRDDVGTEGLVAARPVSQ